MQLFSPYIGPLMGMLSGSFFLHNSCMPIIRHAKDQTKSVRDVFIGYILALISYLICGIMGYYGFSSTYFASYTGITQNSLNMFSAKNSLAIFIRLCVFM